MNPGVVVFATGAMRSPVFTIDGLVVSGTKLMVTPAEFPTASMPLMVWLAGVPGVLE
jgi:hypothetical protein